MIPVPSKYNTFTLFFEDILTVLIGFKDKFKVARLSLSVKIKLPRLLLDRFNS